MFRPGKKALASVGAVLMMLLGVLAIPAPAAAATTLNDQITTEEGPTDVLGGGNHFFVKFGTDAAFGVVWGTETTENYIYFVAIKARYLGVAQVYDRDGNLLEPNHTIKIYTMYAVKLDSIVEFDDMNSNGLLSYQRMYDDGVFQGYDAEESIFKKVDLKNAWTASEVLFEETEDQKSWSFGLSAQNLSYQTLEDYTGPTGDDVLNNLTLTFHLTASAEQVNNVTVNQWRVTVAQGPMGATWFLGAEKVDEDVWSGKMVSYNVKWDQSIEGWDYDDANENPMLLMEIGSIVGNWIPGNAAAWMVNAMLSYMHAVGEMTCQTTQGDVTVNETTGDIGVRQVVSNRMSFGDDWQNIGRFTWVDDVTVDGTPKQVAAQLMAGHRILAVGAGGSVFTGFVVLSGLTFPGGASIFHDPTVSAEAIIDIEPAEKTIPGFVLLLIAVIVVVVVAAMASTALGGKKPGQGVQNSYERSRGSDSGAWAKYYEKK